MNNFRSDNLLIVWPEIQCTGGTELIQPVPLFLLGYKRSQQLPCQRQNGVKKCSLSFKCLICPKVVLRSDSPVGLGIL